MGSPYTSIALADHVSADTSAHDLEEEFRPEPHYTEEANRAWKTTGFCLLAHATREAINAMRNRAAETGRTMRLREDGDDVSDPVDAVVYADGSVEFDIGADFYLLEPLEWASLYITGKLT